MRVALVVPADLDAPTGGNRYDAALAAALPAAGAGVELRPVPGAWPVGSAGDRAALAAALRAGPGAWPAAGGRAETAVGFGAVLADGLLACGAPDEVTGSGAHVLVHLPLALETGLSAGRAAELDQLERRALRGAAGVVATSHWAAAELRRRHGLSAVAVAEPGVDPAPAATGSDPPRLLQLASVTPRKDQLGVVRALALLADLPWTAELAGSVEAGPGYVAAVRAEIDRRGLSGRVRLTGPLTGAGLDAAFAAADLLLLPSRAETWGMAVAEALARGIPAVVAAGTGAEEVLGHAPGGPVPGAVVPAGDPGALAASVRRLLGPGRAEARAAARARARTLPCWPDTAAAVVAAVQ